eukprot:1140092-Pelagomonas_calceolata.AAC.1
MMIRPTEKFPCALSIFYGLRGSLHACLTKSGRRAYPTRKPNLPPPWKIPIETPTRTPTWSGHTQLSYPPPNLDPSLDPNFPSVTRGRGP